MFISVIYYSTIYYYFSKECVLLFAFLCCAYFCLKLSCRANKAALFFTYSHINLLFKNTFFHLSHFDSLSLQMIIKKTFFCKCMAVFVISYIGYRYFRIRGYFWNCFCRSHYNNKQKVLNN